MCLANLHLSHLQPQKPVTAAMLPTTAESPLRSTLCEVHHCSLQGLASSHDPMLHEALLAVAAQLALHTAPLPTSSPPQAGIRSTPHSPGQAAGFGFQQQGIAVQEQMHQALIWAQADPDRPAESSANAIR